MSSKACRRSEGPTRSRSPSSSGSHGTGRKRQCTGAINQRQPTEEGNGFQREEHLAQHFRSAADTSDNNLSGTEGSFSLRSSALSRSESGNSRLQQSVVRSEWAEAEAAQMYERMTSAALPCFLRTSHFGSRWPGLKFMRSDFVPEDQSKADKSALVVWTELSNLANLRDSGLPKFDEKRDEVEIDAVHAVRPREAASTRRHAAAMDDGETARTPGSGETEPDLVALERELAWRESADPALQAYYLCDERKTLRSEGGSPSTKAPRRGRSVASSSASGSKAKGVVASAALAEACVRVARAARFTDEKDRRDFVLNLPWSGRHRPDSRPTAEADNAFWALLLSTKLAVVEAAATRVLPTDSKFMQKAEQLSFNLVFLQLLFSWIRGTACTADLFECAVIGLPAKPDCLTTLDPETDNQQPAAALAGGQLVLPTLTVCTADERRSVGGQGGDRECFPAAMGRESPFRVLLSQRKGLLIQQRRVEERDAVSAVCTAMHSFSGEVTALQRQMTTLNGRMTALERSVRDMNARQEAMQQQQNSLERSVRDMNARQEEMQQQQNAMNARQEDMLTRLPGLIAAELQRVLQSAPRRPDS